MRRWVWRVLMLVAVAMTLTVGVSATVIKPEDIGDKIVVDGVVYDNGTVVGYTESGLKESLSIQDAVGGVTTTAIAPKAFIKCGTLTQVVIPASVANIGEKAFNQCGILKSVIFRDSDETAATAITVTIGPESFAALPDLVTLSLPKENQIDIGEEAFKECPKLDELMIWTGEIASGAFSLCDNLKTVVVDKGVDTIDLKAFDNRLEFIHYAGTDVAEFQKKMPGWSKYKVHVSSNNAFRTSKDTSCETPGSIVERFRCDVKVSGDSPDAPQKECALQIPERTIIIPALGHNWVDDTSKDAEHKEPTCKEPGEDKIPQKCSICGIAGEPRVEPINNKDTPHKYPEDDDPDGKTVVKELFPGRCDGTLGLSMVTKQCAVCGYTPVCWECEDLIWSLEEANAKLEEDKEALADATAKLEAAETAVEQARAAWQAATDALNEVWEAWTPADEAYREAQDETREAQEALNALEALGDAATAEEIEAARKALDEAKAKEAEAKKAFQAVDRLRLEREIEEEEARTKWDEANDAYGVADTKKGNAESAVNGVDGSKQSVSDKQELLRGHLMAENPPTTHVECAKCAELLAAIRAAKGDFAKKKAETAYTTHKANTTEHTPTDIEAGAVSGKNSDKAPEHDWGDPEVPAYDRPECGSGDSVRVTPQYTCKDCGATKPGKPEILDAAAKHKPPANVGVKEKTPATCTEPGKIVYEDYLCETCNRHVEGDEGVILATGHHWVDKPELDEIIRKPSCVDGGLKNTYRVCDNENCPLEGEPQLKESNVPIEPNPKGHTWGEFTPESDDPEAMKPNTTCASKTVTGKVKCTVCGTEETRTLTIEGLGAHTWDEWKPSADGKTETHTCKVCGETETRPAASKPEDDPCKDGHTWGEWIPSADGKTETHTCKVCGETETRPAGTTEPDKPESYQISVIPGPGGAASANRSTAKSGDTVTLTVTASSGYELDMIRAIRGGTSVVSLTDLGGGQYRFTMPADNVEVRVTFSRKDSGYWSGSNWASAPGEGSGSTDPVRTQDTAPAQITSPAGTPRAGAWGQLYLDLPASHWAAGEINWASQMGYMSGSNGRFNPDGTITDQQVWMVMARLMGTYPANMAEARRWAVQTGFATGSAPERAMTRHQVVTALYRCAVLRGRAARPSGLTLAGYADSSQVPAVARDAMIWAVSNGIVTGDSSSRLNPTAAVTRAQFAVLLYRFSQRI